MEQVGDTNENIQQNKVNEQISEKIQELENCSAQTQEVSKGTLSLKYCNPHDLQQ